jgi:hypothetical protein
MTTVEQIANAVLYEGYLLYPYRRSAVKNQQRWNFGILHPRNYPGTTDGTHPGFMQTECLMLGDASSRMEIRLRFLQVITRQALDRDGKPVDSLEVGGDLYQTWQEAMEREIFLAYRVADAPLSHEFRFEPTFQVQYLLDQGEEIAGALQRQTKLLQGTVEVNSVAVQEGVHRVRVRITNFTDTSSTNHQAVVLDSFVSTHTILQVTGGEFISLLEPPGELAKEASGCRNVNTWPVLAGDRERRDAVLSSPIILYDYPDVAAESPGELFDGTEIDEILTLRILTMTDEEKSEMRRGDERARRILQRTETLPPEHFAKLHGALRGVPAREGGGV